MLATTDITQHNIAPDSADRAATEAVIPTVMAIADISSDAPEPVAELTFGTASAEIELTDGPSAMGAPDSARLASARCEAHLVSEASSAQRVLGRLAEAGSFSKDPNENRLIRPMVGASEDACCPRPARDSRRLERLLGRELDREAEPQPDEPAALPAAATGALGELLDGGYAARDCALRATIGVGLSALFGLALGMQQGGTSLLSGAAGIALAPLGVLILGVPALHIVLSVLNVPIELPQLMRAAARGSAATGLALSGLSPALALFVVTADNRWLPLVVAGGGLVVAGAFGLRHFRHVLFAALQDTPQNKLAAAHFALIGFALFSTTLAGRVWWHTLSTIGGYS